MPRVLALLFAITICTTAHAYTNKPFGEYYPHTRWIDQETHTIQLDAYPHRLVITQKSKRPMIIHGCWRGRAFLRDCRSDYFGVAHEGVDADISGDPRFENFSFRRVRPDPKT